MKKIALSLILAFGLAQANCSFSQPNAVDVTWKAFKTPLKKGVGGHFKQINFNSSVKSAKSLDALLAGSTVNIEVASVDSKNAGRDVKLLEQFFKKMSGPDIKAKILSLKRDKDARKTGIVTIAVTMNGVSKEVPMRYSFSEGVLSAHGVIDLVDFNATPALQSINKACFALHQGKTWSDVNIGFSMKIQASCSQPLKGHN